MFLDPRFKHSFASNKDAFVRQVELWIAEQTEQEFDADLELETVEFAPADQQPCSLDSIFDLHANVVGASYEQQPAKNVSAAQELLKYKSEPNLLLSTNPLTYWQVSKFF